MQKAHQHTDHYPEQELLRKYLAGELTAEEELLVADLYERDADFRDTLDGLEALGAEEYTASMDRLSGRLDARLSAGTDDGVIRMTQPGKVVGINQMRRFAIAASVAFLILLGGTIFVHQMKSPTSRLVAANFEAKPYPDVITRGGSDDLSEAEKIAISSYNAGNYSVAADQFGELYQQHPDIAKYGLFLGISNMSSNEFDEAADVLSGLRGNAGTLEQDVAWYLGLSYLKLKDKASAKALFQELSENSDSYYSADAGKILTRLN